MRDGVSIRDWDDAFLRLQNLQLQVDVLAGCDGDSPQSPLDARTAAIDALCAMQRLISREVVRATSVLPMVGAAKTTTDDRSAETSSLSPQRGRRCGAKGSVCFVSRNFSDLSLRWRDATLHHAVSFRRSDLSGAVFERCTLRGVDMARCVLFGCRFVACDLEGVSFRSAVLKGAVFVNCRLVGCTFDAAAGVPRHRWQQAPLTAKMNEFIHCDFERTEYAE